MAWIDIFQHDHLLMLVDTLNELNYRRRWL